MTLQCADLLEANWSDADVLLATSLCFPPNLLGLVQRKCLELKKGARILLMQPDFDERGAYDDDGEEEEAKDDARPCAEDAEFGLRRVAVSEKAPYHGVTMRMSFGDAVFYVYERCEVHGSEDAHEGGAAAKQDRGVGLVARCMASDGRTEWRLL